MARPNPFPIGTRVVDCETDAIGTVVYLYTNPTLANEIVVVQFDFTDHAVAFPIDDLRRLKPKENGELQ